MFADSASASLPRSDRSLTQLNPAFGHSPSAFGLKSVHRTLFRAASPNTLDQLTCYTRTEGTAASEVTDLCYDDSGNLEGTSTNGVCTGPSAERSYTHDANNRMVSASNTSPTMNASYVYGAEDTRIYKQDGTGLEASGYRFSNLNNMVLGEHPGTADSDLGYWRLYVPGLGIDDRVAMVTMDGSTANAVHYYMPNRIGSVIGMVNTAGVLTDQYLYSPYGVEEPLAGSGNLFRYTGRYYDAETGLYYYRKRYYDPGTGRFPSPDSILYAGGLNIYNYTGGDPINNVDPSGQEIFEKGRFNVTVSLGGSGTVAAPTSGLPGANAGADLLVQVSIGSPDSSKFNPNLGPITSPLNLLNMVVDVEKFAVQVDDGISGDNGSVGFSLDVDAGEIGISLGTPSDREGTTFTGEFDIGSAGGEIFSSGQKLAGSGVRLSILGPGLAAAFSKSETTTILEVDLREDETE